MELNFEAMLSCQFKRMTRPKFKHEFTTFNDEQAFMNYEDEST